MLNQYDLRLASNHKSEWNIGCAFQGQTEWILHTKLLLLSLICNTSQGTAGGHRHRLITYCMLQGIQTKLSVFATSLFVLMTLIRIRTAKSTLTMSTVLVKPTHSRSLNWVSLGLPTDQGEKKTFFSLLPPGIWQKCKEASYFSPQPVLKVCVF